MSRAARKFYTFSGCSFFVVYCLVRAFCFSKLMRRQDIEILLFSLYGEVGI